MSRASLELTFFTSEAYCVRGDSLAFGSPIAQETTPGMRTEKLAILEPLHFLSFIAAYLAILCLAWATSAPDVWLAGALAIPLIWLSLADLAEKEIPNLATMAVAIVGLSAAWGNATALAENAIVAGFILVVLSLGSELVWRKTGRDVLGLGDVKLIGAGVLVVGASSAWIMIVLASVGGILAALLVLRRHEAGIPFGPFLAYAIFITFQFFGAHA